MRQDFDLTSFTAGELSPRMKGRTDYARYFSGCESLQNMVVMPQGGATRRPGTMFVQASPDQANPCRLRRFIFSTSQAYMLAFVAGAVRVYRDDGVLLNPQAVLGAAAAPDGVARLRLASAAGIYTGSPISVAGVAGTTEANGSWTARAVTAATAVTGTANNGNGSVRLTVADTSHLIDGSQIVVTAIGGTIEANGTWTARLIDATHIDLPGSVFANAYTAGGSVAGPDATLVDLPGCVFAHAWTGGGTATATVQIPVPYTTAELRQLYFAQSDDVLFICHPNHPAATLSRQANTVWAYAPLAFRDGPYLDTNTTATTLAVTGAGTSYPGGVQLVGYGLGYTTVVNPGTASRSVTVTASSTLGINPSAHSIGQGFLASDIGRPLRVKLVASWCWMVIDQVVSPTEVTATLQQTVFGGAWGNLDGSAWQQNTYYPEGVVVLAGAQYFRCTSDGNSGTTAPTWSSSATTYQVADGGVIWTYLPSAAAPGPTTFWRLGKWTLGVYPAVCSFWQQRLMFLGTIAQPNAIEGSVLGDFTSFAPTAQDGTVVATNALSFIISDDQENAIQWVKAAGSAQTAQLAIGTVGAEDIMQPSSTAEALSATNVQVYPETANGSRPIEPLRIGKSLIFTDRPGRKLLEWTFSWQVNGYATLELSEASEHITRSGIVDLVYCQAPHRLVWMLLDNGLLVSATYSKDQQVFAPARHRLGGDYWSGPARVEAIDAIPSPDGSFDELWLSVLRTVNGAEFRSIEVLSPWFENATVPQENAVFLDCAASLTPPSPAALLVVSGMTDTALAMQPPAFTGEAVVQTDVAVFGPADLGKLIHVAGGVLIITGVESAVLANALVLRAIGSMAPAAAGSWSYGGTQTAVHGLTWLVGETVGVLGDGAELDRAVVAANGSVVLSEPAAVVTAGLPYSSGILTMPWEPQRAAAAASSGKVKRIDTMWIRFHESLGCEFGQRLTDPLTFATRDVIEELQTRSAAMPMGQAPRLFSGSRKLRPQGGYDSEGQMLVTTDGALPLTVLSIFARADVADMPGPA